jgi:Na+/melibiose symporter-like transporter
MDPNPDRCASPLSRPSVKLCIILSLLFLSYTFISISYVSWPSWMSELVPEGIRGRFFGTRNMLCGLMGMIAMVVFGKLLDTLNGHASGELPLGFGITFISAVFFGLVSLHFLNRVSEAQKSGQLGGSPISVGRLIYLPFGEPNFRSFLAFTFLWSFSIDFASPFSIFIFLDIQDSATDLWLPWG